VKEEAGLCTCFGDGATNGGAFFESLNIAAAQKLPLLFLCENNEYAIGTKITRVAPFEKQAKKAEPYMPTIEVDGMDVVAVYEAVSEAQQYLEKGHGPIFVEAMTCRYEGKARDPIERMKKVLLEQYGMDAGAIDSLETKAQNEIDEAVSFAAEAAEPAPEALMAHLFTTQGGNYALS